MASVAQKAFEAAKLASGNKPHKPGAAYGNDRESAPGAASRVCCLQRSCFAFAFGIALFGAQERKGDGAGEEACGAP